MKNCKIGNLYVCKFEEAILSGFSFPILEWNDKDKSWTLARNKGFGKKIITQSTRCLFLGRTNSIHIGAFLLGDAITGIEFRYIHED